MNDDAIVLTMNSAQFEASMNKVVQSLITMQQTASQAATQATNSTSTAAKKATSSAGGVLERVKNNISNVIGKIPLVGDSLVNAFNKVPEAINTTGKLGLKISGLGKTAEMTSGMMAMAFMKAQIAATYAIRMIDSAVKTVLANIPEIGQTFAISKDIIMRNLLFPLRKELIPLLQKVLDWTRDHRIMFVKMGTVIVGVFRLIKTVVVGLVEMVQKLWQRVAAGLEAIFGKATRSITDIINLVLFKIAAMVIFIQVLLEPVFKWIVDKLMVMVGAVVDFGQGFISTIGDVSKNFQDFIGIIKDFGNVLDGALGSGNALGKSMTILGEILGMTVKPRLAIIAQMLQGMVDSIDGVVTSVRLAKSFLGGGSKSEREGISSDWQKRSDARMKATNERWSDVVSNTKAGAGKISDTWNDNKVTNTEKVVKSQQVVNNNQKTEVKINVSGSKSPEETARHIASVLQKEKEQAGAAGGY